jgi:hypothetical protein
MAHPKGKPEAKASGYLRLVAWRAKPEGLAYLEAEGLV